MQHFHRSLFTLVTAAMLLSACAGQVPPQLPVRLSMSAEGAVHHAGLGTETLTIKIGQPTGQRIQALSADVERVWVKVHLADGTALSQWIDKALFVADQATATFTGLPPGRVHVRVRAVDAQDQVLGEASGFITVVSGLTSTLELALRLAPVFPNPVTGSAGLTAAATLVDGEVTSPEALPRLDYFIGTLWGNEFSHFTMDPSGDLYVSEFETGRMATYRKSSVPGGPWAPPVNSRDDEKLWMNMWYSNSGGLNRVVCVDAQGFFYTEGTLGSAVGISKFTPDGTLLTHTPVPEAMANHHRAIAVQDTGEVWVANGNAVSKISSTGALLGSYDLGSSTGGVAIDQTRQTIWVALPRAARIVRLSSAGQVLGQIEVAHLGGDTVRDLVLDAAGHLWVLGQDSGLVTRIDPDGQVLRVVRTAGEGLGLAIDDLGNAWAATWLGNKDDFGSVVLFKLAPEGRRLGYFAIGSAYPRGGFHIEFDRHGNLFVPTSEYSSGDFKFDRLQILRTLQ